MEGRAEQQLTPDRLPDGQGQPAGKRFLVVSYILSFLFWPWAIFAAAWVIASDRKEHVRHHAFNFVGVALLPLLLGGLIGLAIVEPWLLVVVIALAIHQWLGGVLGTKLAPSVGYVSDEARGDWRAFGYNWGVIGVVIGWSGCRFAAAFRPKRQVAR